MANAFEKAAVATHRGIYRLSGGKIAGKIGKAPMLLLTVTGRKTGKKRTTPLLYLEDGGSLVVVASAGGQAENPAWYVNLRDNPAVEVQIGSDTKPMKARTASEEERARLWPKVVAIYASYDKYQQKTDREIPLVILDPA